MESIEPTYKACPKCGYSRSDEDKSPPDICPSCGIIYSKWTEHRINGPEIKIHKEIETPLNPLIKLKNYLLYVNPKTDDLFFYGRAVLFIIFFIWGWKFILMTIESNEIGCSFMHRINLVFHEAGHIIFIPFGRFVRILGGSLGQLLMPLIVTFALIIKNRDNFGGSIGLWWFAQSLMDLAPYINDARALKLMLITGGTGADIPGTHDWQNILLTLRLIRYDRAIASGIDAIGTILMLAAFLWGGYILYLQYSNLKKH
jgi:hypothetical protein